MRDDTQGGIEYWWPEGRKWSMSSAKVLSTQYRAGLTDVAVPAIYHYEIREKLILEAAAGDDDVYSMSLSPRLDER